MGIEACNFAGFLPLHMEEVSRFECGKLEGEDKLSILFI